MTGSIVLGKKSSSDVSVKEADVLVVGAGLAGLWAAIRAKDFAPRVVLVDKGKVSRSGASVFCHTTLAPVPEGEFPAWKEEFVERGGYLADEAWIDLVLRKNSQCLSDMETWGVSFVRDDKGKLRTEAIRGQKVTRCCLYTGRQMMEKMRQHALEKGVELVERVMVCELLTSDGRHPTAGGVAGALGLHTRTGEIVVFRSPAVVIAAGPISPKLHCLYIDNVTGDGRAMAFRAGAELAGMEFAPNPGFSVWDRRLSTGGQQQFLMHGARIVNRLGERIMEKYKEAGVKNPEFEGNIEFGDVCRAMAIEILEGRGPVFFDMTGWSQDNIEKMRRVLPATMKAFEEAGIDLSRQPVESTPIIQSYASSSGSGIRIDARGESNIPGLYAAGASAMAGPNIVAQAFCNVTGYQAGEYAGKRGREGHSGQIDGGQVEKLKREILAPLARGQGISPDELYLMANQAVLPYASSLFKNEARIKETLEEIRKLLTEESPRLKAKDTHELVKANEGRNFLQLMELVQLSALERRESRFNHYREDYPYEDNENWLKWVIVKNNGRGGVEVRTEPRKGQTFKPAGPLKKLSRIQYSLGKATGK